MMRIHSANSLSNFLTIILRITVGKSISQEFIYIYATCSFSEHIATFLKKILLLHLWNCHFKGWAVAL